MFLNEIQQLSSSDKLKLYYQTLGAANCISRKRAENRPVEDYNRSYEIILEEMNATAQEYNIPSIDFSSSFLVFKDDAMAQKFNYSEVINERTNFKDQFLAGKTHVLIFPQSGNTSKAQCIFIGDFPKE